MPETEIPSEVDIHSYEGLTRLFRFGIGLRENDADREALALVEFRFGLPRYDPEARGALADTARHLDQLGNRGRFAKVCDMITAASDRQSQLDIDLRHELVRISNSNDIVRFSFAPTMLPCLEHARAARASRQKTYPMFAIRYAGVGPDVHLMAFASLFLNLPIYAEVNPPWDPDAEFITEIKEGPQETNTEVPDLEITFPPADFRAGDAPGLEKSVRKFQLPRAVDRGKYDLESVMLDYLRGAGSSAMAFVSEDFTASTKQSRLKSRQKLLKAKCVNRIAELTTAKPVMVLIELDTTDEETDAIMMESTATIERFLGKLSQGREIRGKSELVTVDNIRSLGDSLAPKRYLSKGPVGGRGIGEVFRNIHTPSTHKLADLFEIIRPKTTKDNPTGTMQINELRPGDISENGNLSGAFRKIHVKPGLEAGLLEQKVKAGDILFAHRGPIGRVGYVTQADVEAADMWAAQSLLIFRPRRQNSGKGLRLYCDPRILFMYLLVPKVRESWLKLAIGDRSPAIPIGEVERFGLPENLLLEKKTQKGRKLESNSKPASYNDLIVDEFGARQAHLMKVREIETSMKDGLDRVWETAWTKMLK